MTRAVRKTAAKVKSIKETGPNGDLIKTKFVEGSLFDPDSQCEAATPDASDGGAHRSCKKSGVTMKDLKKTMKKMALVDPPESQTILEKEKSESDDQNS